MAALIYTVGNFRLDRVNSTLYRDDQALQLQPKLIDTLIFIVERAGQVITTEELVSADQKLHY